MAVATFFINLAISIAVSFVLQAMNRQKERKATNQVHRQGVDHDLERVYGTRRIGVVVTDVITSDQYINPNGLALPSNTIRSDGIFDGRANHDLHGQYLLYYEGPLCVSGRLNAAFQNTLADANFQVNEKDYTDASLKSSSRQAFPAAYELSLNGGVRHSISDSIGLGGPENKFAHQVSATCAFALNIKKEITYSGIPEATFDVTGNLLFWPSAGDTVDNSATWTGRADNPGLQLLDYMLDIDFGFGVSVAEIELSTFDLMAEIGNTPVGTIKTETSFKAFSNNSFGSYNSSTEVKKYVPSNMLESNITLTTEDALNENAEQLLGACRGARLFKNRLGKWAIAPAWLHEDALTQTITSQTGAGPYVMDYATAAIEVTKNSVSTSAFTLNLSATLTTLSTLGVAGTPTGTDPTGNIGITFTTPLISSDTIEISYLKNGTNTAGIPGQAAVLHIVTAPEDLGLDYDADVDSDGLRFCRIHDRTISSLSGVSLDDRFNQCVVKFPDAFTKYKSNQVVWPADGSSQLTTFLAEDNSKPLIQTLGVNSITDQEKALDFAEFVVRQSRSADNISYHLDITSLQLEPNDLVRVSDPAMNINAELWRVGEVAIQTDATARVKLVRYETEDFTFLVESYSTTNVDPEYRTFGPVLNLAYTPDLTNDLSGPGSVTWDAPANATVSSYVMDISHKRVWHGSEAWPNNKKVYYNTQHWKANTVISAGGAAPDVNANWDLLDDDDLYWQQVADTPTLSAMVPDVKLGRVYAFRIRPKSALRFMGIPAYFETIVDPIQAFVVTSFYQNAAPSGQCEHKTDQWFDEDDSDNLWIYNGTIWEDVANYKLANFFGGAADSAVRTRGRCHTFFYYSEPTDADAPNNPTDVLGIGDLWFVPYNSFEYFRYDGSAWVRIAIVQGNQTFVQAVEPVDADSPVGQLQSNDRWVSTTENNIEYIYNGTDWSDQGLPSSNITTQLISKFYLVGDSLTAPNGGDDGAATYNTDGSGNVTGITVTTGGTGYGKNFLYMLRDGTARAYIEFTVNASGVITSGALDQQLGAFSLSQSGVSVGTGLDSNTIASWAFKLHNDDQVPMTIDASNGQSVAVSTTKYVYAAPAATFDQQLAVIHLGGNDSGHVNGDGENISQATFETDYKALIQNFIDDGYQVHCILPSFNDVFDVTNITSIREWVTNSAVAKGVDIWNIPTSNYIDGIHMTQEGHNLWKQVAYQHMLSAASVQYGDSPWLKLLRFSDGFKLSSFLGHFGLADTSDILLIEGDDAGGVRLNYNGAKRLESTTGGVEFSLGATLIGEVNAFGLDMGSKWVSAGLSIMNAGSAATPAYIFDGDASTGMYRYSAGQIGFSSSGDLCATLSSSHLDLGSRGGVNTEGAQLSLRNVAGTARAGTLDVDSADSLRLFPAANKSLKLGCLVGGTGKTYMYYNGGVTATFSNVLETSSVDATYGSLRAKGYNTGFGYRNISLIHGTGLTVAGWASAVTTTTVAMVNNSDRRLKYDIQDYDPTEAMAALKSVNVRDYAWRSDDRRQIGFIADEVQDALPYIEVVQGDRDGELHQTMSFEQMVPFLWAQNKELLRRLEVLEAKPVVEEDSQG